jgi:hypothetical protein
MPDSRGESVTHNRMKELRLGLELGPDGHAIGRDPQHIGPGEWQKLGRAALPILKVIRAKCIDCAGSDTEARRCCATDCPLWPYRMGANPFRERVELTAEQRQQRAETLRSVRQPGIGRKGKAK